MLLCQVPGCNKPQRARMRCNRHYLQARQEGAVAKRAAFFHHAVPLTAIITVRLTEAQRIWLTEHGGQECVRQLVDKAMGVA